MNIYIYNNQYTIFFLNASPKQIFSITSLYHKGTESTRVQSKTTSLFSTLGIRKGFFLIPEKKAEKLPFLKC